MTAKKKKKKNYYYNNKIKIIININNYQNYFFRKVISKFIII